MQDLIRKYDLNYISKHGKTYSFGKYSLPFVFLRDILEVYLLLGDADNEQSNFATELNNFGIIGYNNSWKKGFFKNNLGLFLSERKRLLNIFISRSFPIKNLDKN